MLERFASMTFSMRYGVTGILLKKILEPAIPEIERPQTYALDSKATGIGPKTQCCYIILFSEASLRKATICPPKPSVLFMNFNTSDDGIIPKTE